jgi:hypothetical protein
MAYTEISFLETGYLLSGLAEGVRLYFAVTAVDEIPFENKTVTPVSVTPARRTGYVMGQIIAYDFSGNLLNMDSASVNIRLWDYKKGLNISVYINSDEWGNFMSDELIVNSNYSVSISRQGYNDKYISNVQVLENSTTNLGQIRLYPEDLPGPEVSINKQEDGCVELKWPEMTNPDGLVYYVYRSESINGYYYSVNSEAIDQSYLSLGYLYFTDRDLKNGSTYYYKVEALQPNTGSKGMSDIISAKPEPSDNYQVNIIEPTAIRNIYGTAKYYIQIIPGENFDSNLLINCLNLPSGLTHRFILNGQESTYLSNVVPPVSVILEVTAGSAAAIKEHPFILKMTNTFTGKSREYPLSLTVVQNNGYGIHAEVEKDLVRKEETVRIYGGIFPFMENKRVELSISQSQYPYNSYTQYVYTDKYGKFEDKEWIQTLERGEYELRASWTDDYATVHNSRIQSFTIEKGLSTLTCTRKRDTSPEVGMDFAIAGTFQPELTSPNIILHVIDPDGNISTETAYQDVGEYQITKAFFHKNGIWKFKAYWPGNEDYIGSESRFLTVPVGIDFGRAIILAGGEAEQNNTYWDVSKKLAVETYRDFMAKGFGKDMIYFMINSQTVDIDYNDIPDDVVDDDLPTTGDFTDAIRNHFRYELDAQTPLFIFMQGHGTSDGRFKVLGSDQYISSTDIGNALNDLQNTTECKVILILESCFSGNFIANLSNSAFYDQRIILTSAGNERYNTDASGRISFSRYLFSKLREGDNLRKSFEYARNSMIAMGYPSPQLEDNGDGKADFNDGLLASNIYLTGMLTWGLKPEITGIDTVQVLENASSAPISVRVVKGDMEIRRVWAQIIAPNANISGGDDIIVYPEVELSYNSSSGKYEGTLSGLSQSGLYKIVVMAEDSEHEVSEPGLAYISASGTADPGNVNGDTGVDLADAILSLKICTGADISGQTVSMSADVNNDQRIGQAEAVYVLRKVSGQ